MKVLLFITSHRQVEEYHYFNLFLKRLKLKCDIYIYCNNPDISSEIVSYFKEFEQFKHLFITSLNDGYRMGAIEAINKGIEMGIFNGYDYVIHIHPDVFIIDDTNLLSLLHEHQSNDTVFLVNKCFPNDDTHFAADFFIFKPKLLPKDLFIKELYTYKDSPECYLFYLLKKNNIVYVIVPRFKNDSWYPRRIDDYLRLYHEHDMEKVKELLFILS
jgi:hypothetical protein